MVSVNQRGMDMTAYNLQERASVPLHNLVGMAIFSVYDFLGSTE